MLSHAAIGRRRRHRRHHRPLPPAPLEPCGRHTEATGGRTGEKRLPRYSRTKGRCPACVDPSFGANVLARRHFSSFDCLVTSTHDRYIEGCTSYIYIGGGRKMFSRSGQQRCVETPLWGGTKVLCCSLKLARQNNKRRSAGSLGVREKQIRLPVSIFEVQTLQRGCKGVVN